jgi:uncharacterized metal-binding protein
MRKDLFFYREKVKKERICKRSQKINHPIKCLILKYKSTGHSTGIEHNENCRAVTSLLERDKTLNFLNHYEKTCSIVDKNNSDLLPINYISLESC